MFEHWIIFAALMALSWAIAPLINQYFKADSLYLLFWMRIFVVIGTGLVALQFSPPTDPIFYLCIAGTALCFSYFDWVYFGQAADKGAGIVSRVEGLIVAATFILWLIITPSLLMDYIAQPLRTAGITMSLAGSTYFALKLKHCTVSRETLRIMLPAILIGACGMVLGTIAMRHSDFHSGVWYYAFVQSAFTLSIYTAALSVPAIQTRLSLPKNITLIDPHTIKAALCLAVIWFIHTPSKYYAISQVENPAYVTVIGLTSPFWVLLIYKLLKHKETADIRAGIGVVICAILLVVCTRF